VEKTMRAIRLQHLRLPILLALTGSLFAQTNSVPLLNLPVFPASRWSRENTAPHSAPIFSLGQQGRPGIPAARNAQIASVTTPAVAFGAALYSSGAPAAVAVSVADVNHDGHPDLIVLNVATPLAGSVGVLLGNGDGTYQTVVNYGSGGPTPIALDVVDVNGDGKPDIVVLNDSCAEPNCSNGHAIGVLLGNGDGSFQPPVIYASGGSRVTSMTVADVNGDGKPDLLVAESASDLEGAVGVLLGNGDGTFQPASMFPTGTFGARFLVVADLNGDGKPDLTITDNPDTGQEPGVVGVLLGNGDGTFRTVVTYSSGGNDARQVAVEDLNGDGHPDLVVLNYLNSTLGVLLGNGDGTFQPAVTISVGGPATSFTVGDLNGDGKPDLAVATYNGGVNVLLGNGDGTFKAAVLYASGGIQVTSMAAADVNGDGIPDLLVTNQCRTVACRTNGTVGILLGNGDGTFQDVVVRGSGGHSPMSLVATDVNGDGKPDIIFVNLCADANCFSGSVGVLKNRTTWPTTTALASSPNPSSLGQKVTFVATVTVQGSGKPSLRVKFTDGGVVLGTAPVINGVAVLSKPRLTVGSHSITASYHGDATFGPSTSPVLIQVVR